MFALKLPAPVDKYSSAEEEEEEEEEEHEETALPLLSSPPPSRALTAGQGLQRCRTWVCPRWTGLCWSPAPLESEMKEFLVNLHDVIWFHQNPTWWLR